MADSTNEWDRLLKWSDPHCPHGWMWILERTQTVGLLSFIVLSLPKQDKTHINESCYMIL